MVCQRRDVETQRHDVTAACVFDFIQRRDIGIQRRNVTERVNFNYFTKLYKFEKTPLMKFQPLRTPGMSFSN